MKKLISIAVLTAFVSIACFAQPQQNQGQGHRQGGQGGYAERIQSEKIAFYTKAMELTEEEAQDFWPIFNAIEKDQRELEKAVWAAFRNLNVAIREGKGEGEISTLLDAYLKACEENVNLHAKAVGSYRGILPAAKVAKFFTAQEMFRRQQFNNLRGGYQGGQRPQGGPQGGQWNGQRPQRMQGGPQGMHRGGQQPGGQQGQGE